MKFSVTKFILYETVLIMNEKGNQKVCRCGGGDAESSSDEPVKRRLVQCFGETVSDVFVRSDVVDDGKLLIGPGGPRHRYASCARVAPRS